jgi:hypothetical protein
MENLHLLPPTFARSMKMMACRRELNINGNAQPLYDPAFNHVYRHTALTIPRGKGCGENNLQGSKSWPSRKFQNQSR